MKLNFDVRKCVSFPAGFLLTFCFAAVANADGKIQIKTVDSESDLTINDVQAEVISRDGEKKQAKVNELGEIIFEDLEAGLYELIIKHPNYYIYRLPSVRVIDKKTTPVDTALTALRGKIENVLVTATASSGSLLIVLPPLQVALVAVLKAGFEPGNYECAQKHIKLSNKCL